ncbi:MAG TPA: hypothetical protein VGX45_16465 [Solirubrobacteraceae bacterium]|jgi:transcriptional regulator with XRE-family HTH domain|nr:hypothetical protein [Solirubrobacteraceae bacterium]
MAYPKYIRERARQLRVEKKLSLDEIAERLALPKTTVYSWIVDLPLGRPRRENSHLGNLAMQEKYRVLREWAYEQGLAEYEQLVLRPPFRDFVVLYIAEGYKRSRNRVAIGNSDDRMVAMATSWLRALGLKPPKFSLQYHADQDLRESASSGARCSRSTGRRSPCSENRIADSSLVERGGPSTVC